MTRRSILLAGALAALAAAPAQGANLTPPNLGGASSLADQDLFVVWPNASNGPLESIPWSALRGQIATALRPTWLLPANNLSELTNIAAARANLGLGGAATVNTGVSGAVVPLLNGANSWSAGQTVSAGGQSWQLQLNETTPGAFDNNVLYANNGASEWLLGARDHTGGGDFGLYNYTLGAFDLNVSNTTGLVTVSHGLTTSGGTTTLGGSATDATVINSTSVTKPNAPAFSARLTTDLTNVTGDGTIYTVVFPTTIFDRDSNFNTGTGVFTAPVTGLYQFNFYCTLTGMTSSHTRAYVQIVTTARAYVLQIGSPYAEQTSAGFVGYTLTALADMTANDTAKAVIEVLGGAKVVSLNSNAGTGASNPTCHFSGFLVA